MQACIKAGLVLKLVQCVVHFWLLWLVQQCSLVDYSTTISFKSNLIRKNDSNNLDSLKACKRSSFFQAKIIGRFYVYGRGWRRRIFWCQRAPRSDFSMKSTDSLDSDCECNVTIMCPYDELSLTMSRVGCLLTDSELFILFAENSQILRKNSVIPILSAFMYLVALDLLVNIV